MEKIAKLLDDAVEEIEGKRYLLCHLWEEENLPRFHVKDILQLLHIDSKEVVVEKPVEYHLTSAVVYKDELYFGTIWEGVIKWGEKRRIRNGSSWDQLFVYKDKLWGLWNPERGTTLVVDVLGKEQKEITGKKYARVTWISFKKGNAYVQYTTVDNEFVIAKFDFEKGKIGKKVCKGKSYHNILRSQFEILGDWIVTCGSGRALIAYNSKTKEKRELYFSDGPGREISRFQVIKKGEEVNIVAGDKGVAPSYLVWIQATGDFRNVTTEKVTLDRVWNVFPLLTGGYELREAIGEGGVERCGK